MTGPRPDFPQTYRDSLESIAGSAHVIHTRLPPNTGGFYVGLPGNLIAIESKFGPGNQDYILGHEYGHRADPNTAYDQGNVGLKNYYNAYLREHPYAKPSGYAATSVNEHFAEAFASAIDFLRRTDKGPGPAPSGYTGFRPHYDDPNDFGRVLEIKDQNVPGTQAIVDWLLNQPLYANHPLKDLRQRTAVQDNPISSFIQTKPDATSVVPAKAAEGSSNPLAAFIRRP